MSDELGISTPAQEPIVTPTEQQEKMLPQSLVKKIAAQEKEEGYLRGKREAEAEYKRLLQEREAKATTQVASEQVQRNEQVPRDVDANVIYQQVQERLNEDLRKKQLEEEMSQVANNYLSRVDLARKSYDDFDDITKDFDPTAFPQVTYLVSGIENAGDVVYELAKNPAKLVMIDALAQKNPKHAQSELLKLSRSISENRAALAQADSQSVAAPLDQLQPSRISGSNGKMSIKDLRAQPWLKG